VSFLNGSIAPYSSPLNVSARGPQYLKASGFPSPRHPGNLQAAFSLPLNGSIRGPWFLKIKEKAKTWIPDKRFRE